MKILNADVQATLNKSWIVYLITNTVNGKKYVGQTKQKLRNRLKGHRWKSSGAGGKNMPIALAIQKYGTEFFTVEILCECSTREDLDEMEKKYAIVHQCMVPSAADTSG